MLFGHRAGKNLLIAELGLHHICLLVRSPSANMKLPSRWATSAQPALCRIPCHGPHSPEKRSICCQAQSDVPEIGRTPRPVDSVQGDNMKRTSLKQFSNRARSLSSL